MALVAEPRMWNLVCARQSYATDAVNRVWSQIGSASVRRLLLPLLLLTFSISTLPAGKHPYLFVWAGDDDKKTSDFLAVLAADPASATYGDVVATQPTGMAGAVPHHTEDPVAATHHLLPNSLAAFRTPPVVL